MDASTSWTTRDPRLSLSLSIDPAADVESWRLSVPAKAACYVLEDAEARPIVLSTVGNLRAALVRRLGGHDETDRSPRRIDYQAIVRRVRYRPVYSRFEADWTYMENVRRLFPNDYKRLIRRWRAYWLSINPLDAYPQFEATDRPTATADTCFGPLPDSKAAKRYVEILEDLFDLCRYHHILVQAPNGEACAYKQMGRCPAPCDGTVSMDVYRRNINAALDFVRGDRMAWRQETEAAMKRAAAELNFELAARFKSQIERAAHASSPAAAHMRALADFRFVVLTNGHRRRRVRVFLVRPGVIEFAGEMQPKRLNDQLAWLGPNITTFHCADDVASDDAAATERIALISWHLLHGKTQQRVLLRAEEAADPDSLRRAVRELMDRKASSKSKENEMESLTSDQPSK